MVFKNKKVRLQDVVEILGDGLHGTPNYSDSGEYFFINGNNLIDGSIIIKKETKRVDELEYQKYKKDLNERTLLISINGTLGRIARYNNEKVILGKSACYLNVKESVNVNYIKYILQSDVFQNYIQRLATGTTIKNVSLKTMREYEFSLPNIEIQNQVESILNPIEEKISLNQGLIIQLEKLTELIFRYWFFDFEFPNEKNLPYRSSDGEMIESELGKIPKGWSVEKLGVIATFKNGKKILDDKKNPNGKNKVYGSNGVIGFTDEVLQPTPSFIIGRVGANCGSVQAALQPCWITDNAIIGIPKDSKYYSYIYEVLKRAGLRAKAGGSAQPLINQNILNNISIIIPTQKIVKDFNKITYKLLQMSDELRLENEKLTLVRDNLLSKLLSGEIEIPDESVVEPS